MKNLHQKKKLHKIAAVAACFFCIALVLMAVPLTRSVLFMSVYSRVCAKDSVLEDAGLKLSISSGDGWYPFVMTFQDDEGFSRYIGEESRLTILYNFPSFTSIFGHTKAFDTESDYYSSFYGAYAVSQEENVYGFDEEGNLNSEEVAVIAKFDFFQLVLGDMGMGRENRVFEWETVEVQEDESYAGSEGWVRADATLYINGMAHSYQSFSASYIQYGFPGKSDTEFEPVTLYGRIYGKYFEEQNVSVFFYVLTADYDLLETTDTEILSQSVLSIMN